MRFLEDPLLEIYKIEGVRIVDLLGFEPLDEEGEVIRYFLTVEDAVNHMAAEKSHLYLVSCMRVNFGILVNRFKDVGRGRTIGEFQLVERLLIDRQFISLFEVFDWHVFEDHIHFTVSVLIHDMSLHVLFLELAYELFEFRRFRAFQPSPTLNTNFLQAFGHGSS